MKIEVLKSKIHRVKVTEADLYVRDRRPKFVTARVVLWKMQDAKGFTQEEIASLAGWDHTTIGHALKK